MAAEARRIEEERLAAEEAELRGEASHFRGAQESETGEEGETEDEQQEEQVAAPVAAGPPTIIEIQAELESKREQMAEVLAECSDDVLFPMFCVHTAASKQSVAATCKSLIQQVLDSCSEAMRKNNESTCNGFEEMVEKAAERPDDIEALDKLTSYIDDAEEHSKDLQAGIDSMVERLEVLEEFQYVSASRMIGLA